jgi:hypothetical protein
MSVALAKSSEPSSPMPQDDMMRFMPRMSTS